MNRRPRRRRWLQLATTVLAVGPLSMTLASYTASASPRASTTTSKAASPKSGGTLTVVGNGDVDNMDTADSYYDVTFGLERTDTRQLYTWPSASTLAKQINPVPDLATKLPAISNGGKTYTITIRKGAMWDAAKPRQVTAADEVYGMKRLCNPVLPTGAPGYFTGTIVGMAAYCSAFLKVKPTLAAVDAYIRGHNIAGVKALNSTTVQFTLIKPATDFIDILSLPFSSPVPAEYGAYLPGSAQLAQHVISDGPYKISSYVPSRSITLVRNPAWKASTDEIRKAYVDKIDVTEGVATSSAALQQVQAGTADMLWDQNVPTAQLAGMVASHNPDLVIGPDGNNFITINPYLSINMQSPNNTGALKNLKVREALEYAINKTADSQIYGGAAVSKPLNQLIPGGSVGNIDGYNPYPTPGNNGDAAKAKQLLSEAGYKSGSITLKLIYRTNTVHPQLAQTDEAALQAAGFKVKLIATTPSGFYTQYLENPTAAKAGQWDIAEAGWIPDWMGNNGRSVIEPLMDGRTYGPNTQDYGDYNNPIVNKDIDKALAATSVGTATISWQAAAKQIMKDAAVVPIGAQKTAVYHASSLNNCLFDFFTQNCDMTNAWLS